MPRNLSPVTDEISTWTPAVGFAQARASMPAVANGIAPIKRYP